MTTGKWRVGAVYASLEEGGSVVRIAGGRCTGFTLIEVMVALAIMVILFALLFAPMIAGLEWVSSGRANVGMQDACRYAMEQIRRELGEAVYVHPAPGYSFSGADNTAGTYDDIRVINYSQILFNPPARDSLGKVYYPPRPATGQNGYQKVIRYAVHLVTPGQPYDEFNPFALYRQEFVWNPNEASPLGSFNSSGVWVPGLPVIENALTPKRGSTFVPTTTLFVDGVGGAGQYPEYVAGYVENTGGRPAAYLFNGLRFEPHRVTGDNLKTDNGVVYRARFGAWDGTSLGGSFLANAALAQSELDPRVMLYAWDAATDTYTIPRVDSYATQARPVQVRWSADGGVVTCGQQARQEWPPASGNIVYYKVINFSTARNATGWYTVSMPSDFTAVYPGNVAAPPVDRASAPTSYRIDPSVDINVPALIQPGTIKVKVVAVDTAGVRRQFDLKPAQNFDQATIRGDEFNVQLMRRDYNNDGAPEGTTALLRFSRFDPPCPASRAFFGNTPPALSSFQLQVSYYYRRNYTYDPQMDAAGNWPFVNDMVKVDYSVRSIQNVSLTLERYVDLEDDGTGRLVLPEGDHPNEVSMREQISIRNFGR